MDEMILRGFVSPEDFTGSPAEKLQAALSAAAGKDIRKVIIEGRWQVDQTLIVPVPVEIILRDAELEMTGEGPLLVNEADVKPERAVWALEDQYLYIKGEPGKKAVLRGGLSWFHLQYLVMEDLQTEGSVRCEFCRELRLERNEMTGTDGPALLLMRGVNNVILQYSSLAGQERALVLDTGAAAGPYVVGKDADIHDVLIRDCRLASASGAAPLQLLACGANRIYNSQADHLTADGPAAELGREGENLPADRYFNLTLCDLGGTPAEKLLLQNETYHCYFA